MESLLQDVRYGLRMLRKSPGFTAIAVLTFALGIGANTTIFSSVNAMLLRPFPFPHLQQVVAVWETVPKQNRVRLSAAPANFLDWAEQSKGFETLAAVHDWNVNLTGSGVAERVEAYQVTADFFRLLGVPPEMGRAIGTADFNHGVAPIVVLSHGFWERHLGSDANVVGKAVLLDGRKFTVVGVASSEFDFPVGAEAWTPLDLSSFKADRADHFLTVIGRLRDGTSIAQAQADLGTVAVRLANQLPETNADHGVRVVSVVEDLTNGSRQFILVLMGAAGFVLLLACANVANLQLARSSSRQKEIALRAALGATRWQVMRQLLVESLLLAGLGGAGGLLLSKWGLVLSRRSIPPFIVNHIPGLRHLERDSRVLLFTMLIALLTGVVSGLAPAWQFSHPDVNEVLKEGTRGASVSVARKRLRTLLVISELALALVLVVGAGLMVNGFRSLLNLEMGFDRSHVLTFHISLPHTKYGDDNRIRSYYDQLLLRLQSTPGVQTAACVTSLPSTWSWNQAEYQAEGQPPPSLGEMRTTIAQSASPDFFKTLRVPLLRGRLLSLEDGATTVPVAVISHSMAGAVWPGQDPIGKHLRLGAKDSKEPWRTVVGVVADIKQSAFDPEPGRTTYVPFAQVPEASSSLAVRTSRDPLALAGAVREQVRTLDADQPAYDIRSLEQVVSDNLSGVEFSARTMVVFGFVAVVLAAAGIFAVMAYYVVQRTHEIGVRVALGARPSDVLGLVMGSAGAMVGAGLVLGVAGAFGMAHALSSVLFGVLQIDVTVFASLTALLAFVAALAAYVPARWATRVDPMVALRYE
jgi:putative ABC transport system permease protein